MSGQRGVGRDLEADGEQRVLQPRHVRFFATDDVLVGVVDVVVGHEPRRRLVTHEEPEPIEVELAQEVLHDSKAGLAARALDGSDEEVSSSVDVQLEALVALLTDALRASSGHRNTPSS